MNKLLIVLLLTLTSNCFANDSKFLSLYPVEDRSIIAEVSEEYGIPIKYLFRLHYLESKLDANAIRHENNGSVSIGYAQINDSNIKEFSDRFNNGVTIDLFDKETNIRISAMYLKYLYTHFDENWINVFCAYNWGYGNMKSGKELPLQVFEYGATIVWGRDFIPSVRIIKGAVAGIM